MTDPNEVIAYLNNGMLTMLPSKKKKKLAVLAWLTEHIPPEKRFSEREFNELLNKLHTFNDPATLRRELYDHYLIDRSPDGTEYWLAPDRPSLEELLAKYCGGAAESPFQGRTRPGLKKTQLRIQTASLPMRQILETGSMLRH